MTDHKPQTVSDEELRVVLRNAMQDVMDGDKWPWGRDDLENALVKALHPFITKPATAEPKAIEQVGEMPRDLENRVSRIEKWIDFWETIETGWNAEPKGVSEALDIAAKLSVEKFPHIESPLVLDIVTQTIAAMQGGKP